MRDSDLRDIINHMNDEESQMLIIKRELINNIEVAKYWSINPVNSKITSRETSKLIFFIKESEKYIGIIYYMGNDFHIYMLEEHRNNRHMTNAFQDVVIPYLFDVLEKDKLVLTSDITQVGDDNFLFVEKLAKKLGFEKQKEENTAIAHYSLKQSDYKFARINLIDLEGKNHSMTAEHLGTLKDEISFASRILLKISDEMNMYFNNDADLKELSDNVGDYIGKIDDLYFENR